MSAGDVSKEARPQNSQGLRVGVVMPTYTVARPPSMVRRQRGLTTRSMVVTTIRSRIPGRPGVVEKEDDQ